MTKRHATVNFLKFFIRGYLECSKWYYLSVSRLPLIQYKNDWFVLWSTASVLMELEYQSAVDLSICQFLDSIVERVNMSYLVGSMREFLHEFQDALTLKMGLIPFLAARSRHSMSSFFDPVCVARWASVMV